MVVRKSLRWAFRVTDWNPDPTQWSQLASFVSTVEKERIQRFVFQRDAKSALIGRLLARRAVCESLSIPWNEIILERTERGRPFVPHCESFDFNVTHHGDWVLLAAESFPKFSSSSPPIIPRVGVDVMKLESRDRSPLDFVTIFKRQLSVREWDYVVGDRDYVLNRFYRIWCLKESYLKADGCGISRDLPSVDFCPKSVLNYDYNCSIVADTTVDLPETLKDTSWNFHEGFLDKDHCWAVCLNSEIVRFVDPENFQRVTIEDLVSDALSVNGIDKVDGVDFLDKDPCWAVCLNSEIVRFVDRENFKRVTIENYVNEIDGGGAWTAETSDFEQQLTIDLGSQMQISSIATQGRQYSSEFVMEYMISYGSNGLDFAYYRGFDGSPKVSPRVYGAGSWSAAGQDFYQKLFIKLSRVSVIKRIATRGDGRDDSYVKAFTLDYSVDGDQWVAFNEPGFGAKVSRSGLLFSRKSRVATFKGNTDSNSLYVNIFDPPIVAQWIRINPTRWQDRISMRLELYGCTYNPDPKAVGLDGVTYFERRVGEDRERYDRPIEFLSYDHPLLRDEIRFRFKTNEADGVILYGWGKQNDVLAVQLVDNRLFLNVGLGGRELTSLSVGSLLDDGIWHDVFISRDKRSVTLSVDRVVVSKSIQGNFQRLNIDFAWYVAGVPSKKRGLDTIRHFKGCLESLYINRHNFFTENPWRPDQAWLIVRESAQASVNSNSIGYDTEPAFVRHDKFMSDIRRQLCNEQQIVPVTFLTSESHVKLKGYEALESLSISFEFRTFEMEGTLVYHKFYSDGYVKLYLQEGYYVVDIVTKGSPGIITANNFLLPVNDGKWHHVELQIRKNKMVSDLDFRPVETVREMDIKTGAYYYFAGGMKGSKGFIGCMKSIVVDGNNQFPLKANPGEMKKSIEIDVDGSGPLTPFPVTCTLNEDEVYTTVERKTRGAIRFSEESGPERIHYPVEYDAGLDEMDLLIDRSVACEQHVAYTCKNGAPLFGQDS
ncbi:unnamed protein product, partial [Notodromas monacha]